MGEYLAQLSGSSQEFFLWQLAYQVIASLKWQAPTSAPDDPILKCTRCTSNQVEDFTHCIWACHLSQQCWRWGEGILQLTNTNPAANVNLSLKHIFIAAPLPTDWRIPKKLWHFLKAIICLQLWKNRNTHYLEDIPTNAQKVIQKSCHRLGICIRKEWCFLL